MNLGIPPKDDNVINETQSTLSVVWENFFSQLTTQLTTTFTNLSYFLPSVSQAALSKIAPNFKKSITYNNDNQRVEINNTGTFEGVQTISVASGADILTAITQPGNIGKIYVNSDTNSLQYSLDGLPANIRTIASA